MLIAMDAEMMLSDHGLTNVVTVSSAAEALRKLKTFKPMAAVLDVNLGVGTSLPIAEELRRQGVPFIFATGYGDSSIIPEDFADVRVVRKPYSDKDLMPAILNLLAD
jgi:CheY-like chemotaxis protein